MTILQRIAYFQGRRDEVPNQELAQELVDTKDNEGIREIVAGLGHQDANVRSDCIKVLYEVGYRDPTLVAAYAPDVLKLLRSKDNRLVSGAMIALSTVASLKPDELFQQRAAILQAMAEDSVITVDAAVKTLATVACARDEYRRELLPHRLEHLSTCRPKDVPQHAESTLPAVNAQHSAEFVPVLERRLPDLSGTQAKRVTKAIRAAKAKTIA